MTDRERYIEAALDALDAPCTCSRRVAMPGVTHRRSDCTGPMTVAVDAMVPLVEADTAEQIAAWLDGEGDELAAALIRSGAWQNGGEP